MKRETAQQNTRLSAVVITYNEEKKLGNCLRSLAKVADELLVIDSFSTDGTEAVALAHGAKFMTHTFNGHIEQKNFAMQQATYPYILSLDADEVLSDELVETILAIKHSGMEHAYAMNRLTNYCGQWIRYCGWYPDRKVRLWHRDSGAWGGQNPHDKVLLKPGIQVRRLEGDLLHYSIGSIAEHLRTINSFSEIAAEQVLLKGTRVNLLLHVVLNPPFTFTKKYLLQRGFLDGFYGLVICVLSAVAKFLKYAKAYQIQISGNKRVH